MPRLGQRVDLRERLNRYISPDPNAGCWLWTGSDDGRLGYGKLHVEGKQAYAHRVMYELFREPIPPGMQIDHLCRNPSCVNPDHLEVVTQQENMRRAPKLGLKLGGKANGERQKAKTHCPQGHPYSGDNLRIVPSTGARYCLICDRNKPSRKRLQAVGG